MIGIGFLGIRTKAMNFHTSTTTHQQAVFTQAKGQVEEVISTDGLFSMTHTIKD